jgi:hypothetical protein
VSYKPLFQFFFCFFSLRFFFVVGGGGGGGLSQIEDDSKDAWPLQI